MNEPSYPLHWPTGWKRTKLPMQSRFGKWNDRVSMSKALDALETELTRAAAWGIIVSCNVRARLDGKPFSNQARPTDCGVAVYFTLNGKRVVLACDKWNRPECNLWAIAKHVEALRGQERWGVGTVEQAFQGYSALNAPSSESCWDVLGLEPNSSEEAITSQFREKAQTAHPDTGGSHEAMIRLTQARDTALATVRAGK